MTGRWRWSPLRIAILVLASIPFLYPFWILITTALKPLREFQASPISWPDQPTLDNLTSAWREAELGRAFVNSVIAVSVGVVACAVISSAAAFWFLRHQGRLAKVMRIAIIGTMALPPPIFVIPLFVLLADLRATNNLVVLGLVYAAWNCGFGLYLMYSYYRGAIPPEVLEAAEVDGASALRQFWRLVLPLSRPALATLSALVFVWTWSDLLLAVVLIQDTSRRTLVPATALLADRYLTDVPAQAAGVLIALVPMLVVFMIGQRYLKQGIMAGIGK
ncbi:MAG TPA: carbohydrate ABC transporter permease [Actinomycetota bacterium]